MEGYEIEVVLVNATFNKKGLLNNGELPIISLEEVDPADYPEFVRLGKWVDDGELLFQPYLRAKIEDTYKNVDISIKINPHTSVKSVSTQAGDIYQKFVRDDGVIYFLPPRKWERDNPQKWPQETVVSHYVSVGSEVLQISFEGRTESMRLISGETDEYSNFYKELIQDLVSIQQQLCIDENSSISTGLIWTEALYENTEQIIDDFCESFWRIEKDAQPELRQYKCKQSFNKVKKITQQALVEHEIFHKDKVTAIAYREVLDTFEHRVIKTHIDRLKKLISDRQNIETTALKNEKLRLESSLKFTEEELEGKFNGLNANIASKKEKLKNVLTDNRPPEFGLQTVFIQIKLNKRDETGKFFEYQISKERPQISLITQKGKKNADDCQYRVKTKTGWSERQAYKTNNAKTTAFINMTLPMDCLESAALLFKYTDSNLDSSKRVNNGDIIGIRGKVLPDYDITKNSNEYASFTFHFRTIEKISRFKKPGEIAEQEEKIFLADEISPEEKESSIAAFRKYILDLFDQIIDNDDDSRGFLEENSDSHKCIKELNDKLNYEEERAKRWNVLKRKLEWIDETDLLKSVSKERTPIRSSNLFSFNPLYRTIYKIMKSNNGAMDGIDYYSTDEEFRVAKLPELYEKWCCIKLVMLFVDSYGFRIKGKNGEYGNDGVLGFKNLIKDILDERESLNGTKFELESDQISEQLNRPMYVSIWYDREFRIDKEDLKKNNVFFAASLRPDIFMKIDYGNKTRLFVFDAKYRGNQNYDGIKDLCEIAFQKYTEELARLKNPVSEFGIYLPSEIISGSFILHSSTQTVADTKVVEGIELRDDSKKDLGNTSSKKSPDVELNYDAKKYLGDYPDIWSEEWIREASDKNWKVNMGKLKEWSTWKSGTNNENKLGIITCNPKSNQLAYVIQMIMEQQFRLYQSKCWICGGEVEVSPKYTETGNLKYHIKCKKCGKFMVETHCGKLGCPSHDKKSKIGKHTENYYASAKSSNLYACWNVSCPVCRQTAPNRKKQSFANCTVVACSAFLVE